MASIKEPSRWSMTGPKTPDVAAGSGPGQARAADHRPRSHRSVQRDPRAAGSGAPSRRQSRRNLRREPPDVASRDLACAISPWVIAPVSGAVAAALVIGVGWMLGWPPVQPAARRAAGQRRRDRRSRRACRRRRVQDRQTRGRRARSGGGRAHRRAGEIAGRAARRTRRACARSRRSSPPPSTTSNRRRAKPRRAPDLSAINERLAQIERASRAQSAEIAQDERQAGGRCAAAPRRGGRAARRSRCGSGDPYRGRAGGGEIAGARCRTR